MNESPATPLQDGAARLLTDALERAPAEREAFLAAACDGKQELLAEVTDLLAAHDAMPGQFLDKPATNDPELSGNLAEEVAHALEGKLPETLPIKRSATSKPTPSNYVSELPLPEELQILLGEAYLVQSFLGQGGMGAVYQGLQMPLRRPVAIKILAKRQPGEEDSFAFEELFKREAYAMAALTHPHIVRVYDCGNAGDQYLFISMELVEGGDLSAAIKEGRVTPEVAFRLIPQICDALQFAHDHGIVHRDIKPANIFLTKDGRANNVGRR